jgi:hypothetical protein
MECRALESRGEGGDGDDVSDEWGAGSPWLRDGGGLGATVQG